VKRLISALFALPLSCSIGEPIFAETTYQPGYSTSTQCFRDEYREEYVPGTKDKPGHVRNWTEKVEIPCQSTSSARKHQQQLLNIHQRLKTLMTTAASKGAFLVDFSVVLQVLLCRGGMDAGLAYPLVEQREQCLVVKWMAVETRLIESLSPSRWFTSSPSDCR